MEQMNAATAVSRLSPELFEMVLIELPTRDLLLAQRVCRSWKAVINTCPNLQRALFFKASLEGAITWVYPEGDWVRILMGKDFSHD